MIFKSKHSEIFSFFYLVQAYYQCRRTKRKSQSATQFELDFEKSLLAMEKELQARTYQCGRYICFAITDPKIREVWAADFRDRITHHLLINYLEPIWEHKFIFHSYACRQEKGAHRAIRYLKKTLHSFNPKKIGSLWYLKIDIESFFMGIDKQVLFGLIKKHVSNDDILWLTHLIIFQNPIDNYFIKGDRKILNSVPKHKSIFYAPETKGLPIGNYTSQFFANLYLNEADQFVKHTLKCKHYFRYMDDLLLLHSDKNQLLKWRREISEFLTKKLLLTLHPKKQILQPVNHGINFLGYIVKPDYTISRKRIVTNLKKKLHYFNKLLDTDTNPWPEIPREKNKKKKSNTCVANAFSYQPTLPLLFSNTLPELELIRKTLATVNSYYGHFQHAHCKKLRIHLYFRYFKKLKTYLEPADKNFSHFVINPSIKKFYQEKTETIRDGTRYETGFHC
ncbi:MAG: hypothetical protein CO138_02405 [Candidatus Moranbacteria bacterium CG_4_9_14_3_um_filter_33_15]|nr:MAG: hypothetical protein CO138_02405 [Candidatus Moranbacteria bacterium CG_4_9_14_3_um_filter_33_15]